MSFCSARHSWSFRGWSNVTGKSGIPSTHETPANVELLLASRLRRLPNINSALGRRLVFAGQFFVRVSFPGSSVIQTVGCMRTTATGTDPFKYLLDSSTRSVILDWISSSSRNRSAYGTPSRRVIRLKSYMLDRRYNTVLSPHSITIYVTRHARKYLPAGFLQLLMTSLKFKFNDYITNFKILKIS